MKKVALVTYSDVPGLTPDDSLLVEPLSELNLEAVATPWDNTAIRWQDFSAIILRSPWNYYRHSDLFLQWFDHLRDKGLPVFNDAELVRWNSDKHYLKELEELGCKVVPSHFVERGSECDLLGILEQNEWEEAVFKPVISASAFMTHRTTVEQAADDQKLFDQALTHSALLVQPLMDGVRTEGEWSLVFFNGQFSHAVLKVPKAGDFRVQGRFGGSYRKASVPDPIIEDANKLLASLSKMPLYARVDCIRDGDTMLLMELEVIEPALYMDSDPASPKKFASAIASLV